VDARRNSTGHVAIIATRLCAEGIDQVRTCRSGEEPGIIVTRYANLAYGYDRSVLTVPIRDHFSATSEARLVPALSSGKTLEAMQIEYWRGHLRHYLPPLSQERYQELKNELERFEVGRTLRKMLSMELLIGVLGPQQKKYPTEPIALIDPLTKELIPNGRWREAIGAAHMRGAMVITAPTSAEQEARFIPFIQAVNKEPFHALADNCSDFVERGLLKVFSDSGLHFRSRVAKVADAWITSPLNVATGFLNYAKNNHVPINVTLVPMMAGTRRPSAAVMSISRGALVPNPAQGKLAFAMKIYFNTLNPLLALTSYSVDKLSRFASLQGVAHDRGGGALSRLAYEVGKKSAASDDDRKAWRREQMRVFGTTSCWKEKQKTFRKLTEQAGELGLLTAAERRLVLMLGRPFLLPRLYEHAAAAQKHDGMLMVGMHNRVLIPTVMISDFVTADSIPQGEQQPTPDPFVPGRPQIWEMADSGNGEERLLAFKLMTSIINYDLSSEPVHRRISDAFDQDWKLLLEVSQKNGLHLPDQDLLREPVAMCSCREFDEGKAKQDAFRENQSGWHRFARESREIVFGANR
jgi:hypothetical protein